LTHAVPVSASHDALVSFRAYLLGLVDFTGQAVEKGSEAGPLIHFDDQSDLSRESGKDF
jgi:hypothetical protein